MKGRYYSLNEYLQERFGQKVYKLALDMGCTCPNRDGTLDTRGCIFCLGGSSHFAQCQGDIHQRIERAKSLVAQKARTDKYIAYFQSYTNTYAPIQQLKDVFSQVIMRGDICALSIATRPDCLGDEVLELLAELNKIKPVWVELGLQTSNEETAKYIRRCYENDVYTRAVEGLNSLGIEVITHIILGLPQETEADMLNSVKFAANAGTKGIKLQLLHILEGTDLCRDYEADRFEAMTLEQYMDILFKCIEILPTDIVIHRITGDAPKRHLVAPKWSADKKTVLNTINRQLEQRDIRQGKNF